MGYISKEQAKEKRDLLKKEYPILKMSITVRNYSRLDVKILEGPVELTPISGRTYEEVNYFYIKEHCKDNWVKKSILQGVYDIMNKGNRTITEDSNYGSVPLFYVSLSIGAWDRPYIGK